MPYFDKYKLRSPAAENWQTVFKNSLRKRISGEKLAPLLAELLSNYPASPTEISDVLLSFRSHNVGMDDPFLFGYAEVLLLGNYIGSSHLLLALLSTSRFVKQPGSEEYEQRITGLPTCEERMFNKVTQLHMTGQLSSPSVVEIHGTVLALTHWMHSVTEFEMGKQLEGGALHAADAYSFGMYEALASLTLTAFSGAAVRNVAKLTWWKKRRTQIVSEMENFDSHVLQWMQSQLSGRLRALTTMPPFLPTDEKGRPIFTDQQILQSVTDVPTAHSRSGLFIWLDACLCARPLTDDLSMLTYLQTRYSDGNESLAVDLLLACFDVLANTLLRKEPEQSIKVVRSFVCNKMPLLLSMLSGYLAPPMTVETSIQMAFMNISMDALPPLSAGANDIRERMKLTRLEFLQACALHSLISESTVSSILPDQSISLPKSKYSKEGLLAQCSNNVDRLEPLIDELDGMVGNSGAIVGCILETINTLCMTKDTTTLKTVCNMLIKKVPCLDIVLLFAQPANLLLPLCTLLNEWVHDQDQGEFTPAYEEFASILLFILAAVHRYSLEKSDLGLATQDNFVAKLLREKTSSKLVSQLTEDQSTQLGKWVEALYATDEHGESSGISDELTRQCPPQEFFMLVPTLFEQSVLACKSGVLPMKTFKGGLELLVEPFLLPSLIGGLSWLVNHAWEDHGDAEILLQIMEKLLRPSISSPETTSMHWTILDIVASPLQETLQDLAKKKPAQKEIKTLMEVLKPHFNSQRIMSSTPAELQEWSTTPDGGIARRIRNAVQDHISWVSNVGPTPPPNYTHRLFAVANKVIGAGPLLDSLVASIREQTDAQKEQVAYDVCSAIITAPLPGAPSPLAGLGGPQPQTYTGGLLVRDMLRLRMADAQQLLKIPAGAAEVMIRLHRRVEAQLVVNQIPQLPITLQMQDQQAAEDQIMADLGLTEDAVGNAGANTSLDQAGGLDATSAAEFANSAMGQAIDLGTGSTQDMTNMQGGADSSVAQNFLDEFNLDLSQNNPQMQNPDLSDMGMGTGEGQGVEEDIFAGLDMDGVDDDFNF